MDKSVLFSSNTVEWETPQYLFDSLDREFNFVIDVAASAENTKCLLYFDKDLDGLSRDWSCYTSIWCNPPYGRGVSLWVKKAFDSSLAGSTVVMLLPARTDTCWFHDYIYHQPNVEIRFIKGRIKFGNSKCNSPFPSMIVIFNKVGDN